MKACFHKSVCKHLIVLGDDPNGPCAIVEACKFYVGMDFNELKKDKREKTAKRSYKRRIKSDSPLDNDISIDDSGVTGKQFKKAKKKIINARQNKRLTENQESALKVMKGLRFKKMTEAQKHQIINIANEL